MTHSDVIIEHVVTSSVKLHQESPNIPDAVINNIIVAYLCTNKKEFIMYRYHEK